MVVEIPRNPVAVGEHVEFAHPALRGRQMQRQPRLRGERRCHPQFRFGELFTRCRHAHQDAGGGVGLTDGQHQRHGASLGEIAEIAGPQRKAIGEGLAHAPYLVIDSRRPRNSVRVEAVITSSPGSPGVA